MAATTIYPKKTPGVANVRKTPAVNTGVVNNLLVSVKYGSAIGTLTGKVAAGVVEGKKYLWFAVSTAKGDGWVREDVFSYALTNAEKQLSPAGERRRIAEAQLKATVAKLKLVGAKLARIGPHQAKLTPGQLKTMDAVRRAYIASLSKLQKTGVATFKLDKPLPGLGIIWTVPLVLGVVSLVGAFGTYALEVIMKKLVELRQVETEADLELKAVDALEKGTLSSDPATVDASIKALQQTTSDIEASKQARAESGDGGDIFDNLKSIATFAVVGFVGLELYKASRGR